MTGTPHQAARYFQKDPATIRRWITAGAPVLRPGGKGPGRSALLDFQEVEQWRGQAVQAAAEQAGDIFEQVARAFQETIQHDRIEDRTGVSKAQAVSVFMLVFDRLCREHRRHYSIDTLPEGIRALMRVL
ncbi:MAG: hypothetical protein ABL970_08925 [Nitrospira sp.]